MNKNERLESLDQFRGYTVLGMLLVNFLGGYEACPKILRHSHDYVSYADTIMPQFLFAVGFAMRLSVGRKLHSQGAISVYSRMVRRLLGLVLVSLVVYNAGLRVENWQQLRELGFWGAIQGPLKRDWFQTLMHIAVTSLWILPVIHARITTRLSWMLGSALLHVLLSYWFNYVWVNTSPNGIDGGPLGFLSWTIPAMLGTVACDMFVPAPNAEPRRNPVLKSLALSFSVMLIGFGFSCGTRFYDSAESLGSDGSAVKIADHPVLPSKDQIQIKRETSEGIWDFLAEPPFVPPPSWEQRKWNYWMMSQRGGTLSYLTFSAGFSLLVFLFFYLVCDKAKLRLGVFHTFGTNALLAYVLHDMIGNAIGPFVPKDSPTWYVAGWLAIFFCVNWLFVRHFEKSGWFLRV
ncbi:MAG: DUF1624 domain-containing protein [Planctomycetales bacterium]|nr:DUF1624 domain-containing protein [Planctomycetales bacterium]